VTPPLSTASSPAPLITYQTNLAIFNGINPNGEWKLLVVDDEFFDLGAIKDGCSLSISTADPFRTLRWR